MLIGNKWLHVCFTVSALTLVIDVCSIHFYTVLKAIIHSAEQKLFLGAAMLEGSIPVSVLVPSLHRILHYGKQTRRFGRLEPLGMWIFERLNYFFKNHFIRNNSRPMESAGLCVCVSVWQSGCWYAFILSHQVLLPCLRDLQRVLLMYMTR